MKTIRFILTATVLFAGMCVFSQRQQIGTSDAYWELVINGEDTTLKISGSGDMPDFTALAGTVNTPWFSVCKTLKYLEIGDSITHIGSYSFFTCSRLTGNVSIPDETTSIGEGVFFNCSELTSIPLHDNINSIGDYAFFGCYGLTSIHIPNGLTRIGNNTFFLCRSLTSVELPENVTSIGISAFGSCAGLESIYLPSNLSSIGIGAFLSCGSLNQIINVNPVPVEITENVFSGVNTNACTLKVPGNSIPLYTEAPVWENFLIEEYIETAISTLETKTKQTILYPSPAKDMIYIRSVNDIQQIIIYDITGKQIKQVNTPEQSVEVNDLTAGVYFVKIKTLDSETVQKIIKQ